LKDLQRYKFCSALRPFSLVVAIISSALGIVIAWTDGFAGLPLAFLVMLGGIAAQAGINLINDVEDLSYLTLDHRHALQALTLIKRNMKAGILCFVLAAGIAIYLSLLQGWILFLLIMISAVSALAYNMGPVNFKHRGLAIVQVFILMGVAMVQGAYYSMAGQFSVPALLHSFPIGLLVSVLLLSNELRDLEVDQQLGVNTFTVRAGIDNSQRLYWLLIVCSYSLSLLYYVTEQLQQPLWLLLPLPLLLSIRDCMYSTARAKLTPLTGRFFFAFGIAYLLAIGQLF
jgi:1,4-dihydroxy-2-naphthoate octaprenyltransferase